MSRLGDHWNDWRNAPIATNDFIKPEDGTYRVIIEGVRYKETDDQGNMTDPTFIYTFRILEGNNQGQRFRRFTTIRDERSASYFKGDMQKLGLPIPANPEELPNVYMSVGGTVVDVTVRTKTINGKEYKDIYFDRLVGKQQQPQQVQLPQPQRAVQPQQTFGGQPTARPLSAQNMEAPFDGGYYDQSIPF